MKILILFCIISFIGIVYLYVKGVMDKEPEPGNGTVIKYPDEFSPENIKIDKALKVINLRKKLNKIEEERIEDMNVNYDGYKK